MGYPDVMLSWFRKGKPTQSSVSAEPASPVSSEIPCTFTLGLEHRPNVPVSHVFPPVVLDPRLWPGATVCGRLVYAHRARVTWIRRGVPSLLEGDQDLIGLEAHVFLPSGEEIEDCRVNLLRVYRAAVLECLLHEPIGSLNAQTAQANLLLLKRKTSLDREEREFQQLLEQAPTFTARDEGGDAPTRLSIHQARAAAQSESLFLLGGFLERDLMSRALAKGAVCLKAHSIVEGVLEAYGLSWQDDGALEDMALGSERIVSSRLRKAALELSFLAARWSGGAVVIPVHGQAPLTFDFENKTVSGPRKHDGPATLEFARLLRADIDIWEVMGDTKTHTFAYLHLSDGHTSLVYVEHAREFFERHSDTHRLEAEQRHAMRILHAIPAALGVTPRLARPALASAQPLRALVVETA